MSSIYWQDFFQRKASGTDGVVKARAWRQVQQSSARGIVLAALSCCSEIVAGASEHVSAQLTQPGACNGGQGGGVAVVVTVSLAFGHFTGSEHGQRSGLHGEKEETRSTAEEKAAAF